MKYLISLFMVLALSGIPSFAADITDTIGTTGRDFSTITLWEDSLSAHTGDNVTGECYNDSVFDESAAIDDSTPTSSILSVASGERHDGTEGTGARIVRTTTGVLMMSDTAGETTVEWLELDANGNDTDGGIFQNNDNGHVHGRISNLIIHGSSGTGNFVRGINSTGDTDINNTIIYDLTTTQTSNRNVYGIFNNNRDIWAQNVTIHNLTNDNGTAECIGVSHRDNSDTKLQNIVVTEVDGTSSGTIQGFEIESPTNAIIDHNASFDTTASGTGSLDSITTANQYVSTTEGSEDLHIQDTDADIFEAGTDLGTTPSGVQFDIDNYDRDTGATTWSIGAHDGNNLRGAAVANPPRQRQVIKMLEF